MNIHAIPMLISAILCLLIAVITWISRRREHINRVFAFFTLALALDSASFFLWGQFGNKAYIDIWMRIIVTTGFVVPIAIILFFYAFTGYDERPNDKVLGIRAKHFKWFYLSVFIFAMLTTPFTDLLMIIKETPQDVWDYETGPLGYIMYPLFALFNVYLLTMAFKSYRETANRARKRFILTLCVAMVVWVAMGFMGAILFSPVGTTTQTINYTGVALMALVFYVAIVNYQSDQVHELNVDLEQKVMDRTRELDRKNNELEQTLNQLQGMQEQVIMREKMATLGQIVAGVTHEINTPIGAMRSMNDTKAKAVEKLLTRFNTAGLDDAEMIKLIDVIRQADRTIDQGTERLHEIIQNLKNFARLDEAEKSKADIHKGLDSVLALIKHDLLNGITVVREYGNIPAFVHHVRKMNQVFYNLLRTASQSIAGEGQITITTGIQDDKVHISIRDSGRGYSQDELQSIFDPGFTTSSSVVRASLDLASSYQIVQEHGGEIRVESQPGQGAIFTILLTTA